MYLTLDIYTHMMAHIYQKSSSPYSKEMITAPFAVGIEQEVLDADILLPSILPFKQLQMSEKYPKVHSRGRHWKHLKQILQAENYHLYPADEPNYLNVESPPSMYPAKKYCDISGFVAPYTDPRTKLRYANIDVFKSVRYLSNDHIQGYLGLRNAAVVLK
ncbi:protein EIN6 ENHANCER [Cryptomeria japonica]|uniref:protein EIN6 ENHANCER n=1 Tax=Cryptomeria japonica TaxID=3369 RepID=UPI0027DA8FE2|nr:protein EIN6 ENHANCER [Cryptomeria japonica]XP_057823125.2 protein EIN6 ENHANCER [Cryptomeria japonica]